MAETIKAKQRREREGFFEKYIHPPIIDIGCAGDMKTGKPDVIDITARMYDMIFGDGDAQYMPDIPDESFLTVYCSHILEHLPDPITAIKNWFRILKPGGYLIIDVPSMLLYEKKTDLPSRWNADHKVFYVLEIDESDNPYPSHVHGLLNDITTALPPNDYLLIEVKTLEEGYQANGNNHPAGEYSLEVIVQKQESITVQDMIRGKAKRKGKTPN